MDRAEGAPLIRAIRGRDWSRARDLLAAGADPNVRDEEGVPALTLLCREPTSQSWLAALDALLAAGADVRYRDVQGYTAEMSFVDEHEESEISSPATKASQASPALAALDALLAALVAADPPVPNHEVLLRLRQAGSVAAGCEEIALLRAAERGDLAAARSALAAGATGRFESWRGNTALVEAVRRQNREMLELLLAAGADLEAGNVTPLQEAAEAGDREMVERLLAAGADPDHGRPGLRPVERAAAHPEIVALLGGPNRQWLELGVVPSVPSLDGNLAVITVEAALPVVVAALEASLASPDDWSVSPLEVGAEVEVPEAAFLLWQPAGGVWTAVHPLSGGPTSAGFGRALAVRLSAVGRVLAYDASDFLGALGYELLEAGTTVEILLLSDDDQDSPIGLVERATLGQLGDGALAAGFWSQQEAAPPGEREGTETFLHRRFAAQRLWLPSVSLPVSLKPGRQLRVLAGLLPMQVEGAVLASFSRKRGHGKEDAKG